MVKRLVFRCLVFCAFIAVSVAGARADGSVALSGRQLDPLRVEKIGDYVRNEIAADYFAGAVVLVQQHGKPVLLQSYGVRDTATNVPMTSDTIFRIYSMSKPITAAAVMMLVDDGKLKLDDPLAKYIPAFADVKVAVTTPDEKTMQGLEPLARPITILDLLRHTSGITYGFIGDTAVRRLYSGSNLFDGDFDNATFVDRLAKLPLAEQPDTKWDYGHSFDVLGRVIEVISGQSLYQFEKQRLLDPLGMNETTFGLADPSQRSRVAEPLPQYHFFDRPIAGLADPIQRRKWESGGAGMISTIGDYGRFAQMMLNGGALDGRRYLKPETVALMTRDHLGPEISREKLYFPGPRSGFGLGFAVRTAATPPFSTGEYRWSGAGGTFFLIDPKDDLFVIMMVQAPLGQNEIEVRRLVFEALTP